jgi:hypothetical protein
MQAGSGQTRTQLQRWLELMEASERHARHELLNHACERLRHLSSRMPRGSPRVLPGEQTDDVLLNALLRL